MPDNYLRHVYTTLAIFLVAGLGADVPSRAAAQTFNDVPTDYWAFSFIETLAGNGITTGCGGRNYCPENPLTRAQLAVFLERGMRGSGFSPPAATGNIFLDVGADDFAASFIEQLFLDGITAGCGNNNYCPNDEVSRAQMAVFLLRAKYGAGYSPPSPSGVFLDVDLSHWAGAWIEQLAAEGITAGCGDGNYCPEDSVTRAQIAVFLVRTFNLKAPPFGLDTRPDNQTCVAPARPTSDATVAVIDPFPSLPNIIQPTKMLLEPVANPRWFVLQKTGQLVTFDPSNAISVSLYLDRSAVVRTESEGGLLGMAFHPDYPNTPEIFLSYTINYSGPPMRSVVSRVILDDVVSPGAGTVEQVILEVDQDFDNHNGGDIAFGVDGFLYIGFGDGGSADDPNNRGQDTKRLLGSMLRIDVLSPGVSHPGNPYNIPSNNPFSGNAECGPGQNTDNCPEIYAWGLRNPWRWSFDPATEDLWVADVGQATWEEVDLMELGGNYGWRCREGAHDFNLDGCGSGLIDPVAEYGHDEGNSITGGAVYRGTAIPELNGHYVFADFGSGRIWALQSDGQGGYTNDELVNTNFGPTSFAADQVGELYFTDMNNDRLRMIVPAGAGTPDMIPMLLSETGCTEPGNITQPYDGLVPYDINALFWSDGAVKERFIGLPNGTTITRDADDDWDFPNGTVIVKNFRLQGNLIETRHLMRHPDGVWAGYTYEWNSQQTEATRVQGGKFVSIAGQDWIFPSEGQCMQCHTSAAGFSLGPETAQLNGDFSYPSTLRIANQLETLEHILMFTSPLPGPVEGLPAISDPADNNASLTDRARAYLHTNCAQCHRPGGPTPSTMDLRYDTSLANTIACDAVPLEGDLGIANARLIAAGDSARSVLVNRAGRRDSNGMPPLGSNQVDSAGVALLSDWIDGLTGCN